MGVPTEVDGPVRKRPRLSLRTNKPTPPENMIVVTMETPTAEMSPSNPGDGPLQFSSDTQSSSLLAKTLGTSSTFSSDRTADLPALSDPPVAPVASLHNLGNTCFLNSMLEVLRYTPGFVEGLGQLQKELVQEDKEKDEIQTSDEAMSEVRPVWQIVKNTYAMYEEMDSKEEQYQQLATSDASSMAIRPTVLLDNIRELNPMFDGHFQHDAQELLRCLLCYIEDADKELQQEREKAKMKAEREIEEKLRQAKLETEAQEADKGVNLCSKGHNLKGGDIHSGGRARSGRRRGTKGPKISTASRTFMENFISSDKNSKDTSKIICEGGTTHQSVSKSDIKEDEVDGPSAASEENRHSVIDSCTENSSGLDFPPSSVGTTISRGSKRKRSNSREKTQSRNTKTRNDAPQVKQAVSEQDQSKSSTSNSAIKLQVDQMPGTNVMDKETISLKGEEDSVVCDQNESEMQVRGGTDGTSLLQKLQQKLSLKAGGKNAEKCPPKETAEPSQPSILSMFPLKQIKRLGMRGRIIFDSVSQTNRASATDDPPTVVDDENNNNNDDNNNNSYSDNNNNSNNNNQNNLLLTGSRQECEASASSVASQTNYLNGYISTLANLSPRKLLYSAESVPSTKTTVTSPAKSSTVVEVSDEISSVVDNRISSVESTIDSVTKKYYSTLSQSGKLALPSTIPQPLELPTSSPISAAFDSEIIVIGPGTSSSSHPSEVVQPETLSSSHSLVSDETITIHSPSKKGYSPGKVIIYSSPERPFSIASYSKNSVQNNRNMSCESAIFNKQTSAVENQSNCPEVLSSFTDMFSPVLSRPRSGSLGKLGHTTFHAAKSRSAPNSPTAHSQSNTSFQFPAPLTKTSISQELSNPGSPQSSKDTVSVRQPRLELKKCDWLGVSPVRSISAKAALSVLEPISGRPVGNVRSAKRRILCDDSDANDSVNKMQNLKNSSSSQATSSRKTVAIREIPTLSDYSLLQSSENRSSIVSAPRPILPISEGLLQPKLELQKCDWLGASPVNSISAREALSAIDSSPKGGVGNASLARKRILCDDIDDNSSGRRDSKNSVSANSCSQICLSSAGSSSHTVLRQKKDIKLRPLSISLDKCDWLLAAKRGQTISAKQVMLNLRKGSERKTVNREKDINSKGNGAKKSRAPEKRIQSSDTPPEPKSSPNQGTLVERLFGGTMMHRTKCLECEISREKQEVFLDISVPVRNLNDGDTDSDMEEDADLAGGSSESCLSKLMKAFSSVERLKDTNKYYCEKCTHYVEAERSCHYTTLPAVLTLHLKRFSANSGLFGGVSKLNDKVTIPQNLPCLRYKCHSPCTDATHRYSLFAIVTHSGLSILHGHYRAYVKVQPQVNPTVFEGIWKSRMKEEKPFIGETVKAEDVPECKLSPCPGAMFSDLTPVKQSIFGAENGVIDESLMYSAAGFLNEEKDVSDSNSPTNFKGSNNTGKFKTSELLCNGENHGDEMKPKLVNSCPGINAGESENWKEEDMEGTDTKPGCFWLECDDECIKVMEENEFAEKLEEKDGALMGTPYVLFYHQLTGPDS